jgi:ribosomal protein L40E
METWELDGVTIFVLLLLFAGLAFLAGPGRSRHDDMLRRRNDSRINEQLYRTTPTDATGSLICRRCGTEGSERAGACRRCGAAL